MLFFQRLFRGYSNDELWDLGYAMACWLYPRLAAFRNRTIGCPCYLEWGEWKGILDRMVWALKFIRDGENERKYIYSLEECHRRKDEGCKLIGEYWNHLWW